VLLLLLLLLLLQEDAHLVDLRVDDQGTALFGVFDGHAGKEVASYCAQHMVSLTTPGSIWQVPRTE
jgi:serine/threonine protein phosphatase PrpC